MKPFRRLATIAVTFCTGGCDLPRDPRGTLERLGGEDLRVGVTEHEPWTRRANGEAAGIEVDLVREFAGELGTKARFDWGPEQEIFEGLERFELDLVIGGVTDATPWAAKVGLTKPYFEREVTVIDSGERKSKKKRHVMAVAPGENGFLRRLETFLRRKRASIPDRLERAE